MRKLARLLAPLFSTVLTCGVAGTAMATDMMVLESTPFDLFSKGQILTLKSGVIYHGKQKLVLAPKQRVKVVLCDGQTATLAGINPKLPVISKFTGNVKVFGSLIDDLDTTTVPKPDGDDDERGNEDTPLTLWMIDVSTSATYCVRPEDIEDELVELWRPENNRQESQLLLTHQLQSVTVTWEAEEATRLWPSKLPIVEGTYSVKLGEGEANTLTLRLLPAELSTDAMKMIWMAENGCLPQARRLFDVGDWDE